jgi:1,4-dihydroxy-2-naphthoate octaprenyltransferase
LFIASFPDHDADKSKGRKTLVIAVGKEKSSKLFWVFPIVSYLAIVIGVSANLFPIFSLISFFSIPLMIKSGLGLRKHYDSVDSLVPFMSSTLMFGRLTGTLFVIGFLIPL